jgi:hypothetical protein
MSVYLQSISDEAKFWTGTTAKQRTNEPPIAIFTEDINVARDFGTRQNASDHAETINVPVQIYETS